MTLDQLRIFLVVAEHQHITNAAKALNMTQSAVSAAVLALEQRHGVTLFDRVGRSIVLNQAGSVFLQRAKQVLAEARAAEAALNDLSGLQRGELSVMASQTIGAHWLPRRLAQFHGLYPGIAFDIRIGNTEAVANAVDAGIVELGLVEGKVDRPTISRRKIAIDEMIIVAAPEHPLAKQKHLDRDRLQASTWVLREAGSGTRHAFEMLIGDEGLKMSELNVAMVLPGNEAVLGAVEAGLGATLTSRSAAAKELAVGVLTQCAYLPVPRPFFILRHKERYRSRAGTTFEDMLNER